MRFLAVLLLVTACGHADPRPGPMTHPKDAVAYPCWVGDRVEVRGIEHVCVRSDQWMAVD
jgi:hypothetical protein